ncbi:MAG: hypothetical protein OHK0032_00890 [Thermodesulfovibrionales bacterium]
MQYNKRFIARPLRIELSFDRLRMHGELVEPKSDIARPDPARIFSCRFLMRQFALTMRIESIKIKLLNKNRVQRCHGIVSF